MRTKIFAIMVVCLAMIAKTGAQCSANGASGPSAPERALVGAAIGGGAGAGFGYAIGHPHAGALLGTGVGALIGLERKPKPQAEKPLRLRDGEKESKDSPYRGTMDAPVENPPEPPFNFAGSHFWLRKLNGSGNGRALEPVVMRGVEHLGGIVETNPKLAQYAVDMTIEPVRWANCSYSENYWITVIGYGRARAEGRGLARVSFDIYDTAGTHVARLAPMRELEVVSYHRSQSGVTSYAVVYYNRQQYEDFGLADPATEAGIYATELIFKLRNGDPELKNRPK